MDDSNVIDPAAASDVLPEPAQVEPSAAGRRFRGKNKKARWKRDEDCELAVIRLPLDVHPDDEPRLEQLFSGMWTVKRALQRDARDAVDAYWAGTSRREADAKAWRHELGLTREGMERRAYAHMERAGWLGHHVTNGDLLSRGVEVQCLSGGHRVDQDLEFGRRGRRGPGPPPAPQRDRGGQPAADGANRLGPARRWWRGRRSGPPSLRHRCPRPVVAPPQVPGR